MGRRQVRERPQERHVVRVHAVRQRVVRGDVEVGRERCATGKGAELDVGDVVDEATAVREAVVLPGEQAEAVLLPRSAVVGMDVLRRIISPPFTFFGMFTPSMPVTKIDTRSFRGAGGTFTPGIERGDEPGRFGVLRRTGRNCASPVGFDALNLSFFPSGMTTSFTSGMPRRDTCTHAPLW